MVIDDVVVSIAVTDDAISVGIRVEVFGGFGDEFFAYPGDVVVPDNDGDSGIVLEISGDVIMEMVGRVPEVVRLL